MDQQLDKIVIDDFQISNPFPGLRSFEEDENILFFGREKQVDDLIRKLRKNRFLGVIGTSGSGKSSLVKSGLLPSLYGGFMAGAGSHWRTVTFRPGTNPIGNMAKALNHSGQGILHKIGVDSVEYSDLIETTLRRSNQGLIEYYKQNTTNNREHLLVLIDQFEEIFRFSEFEKSAKDGFRDSTAFINLLLKTAEQTELPIYIVFTMRSDFLGDCTSFKGLPEAINDGHYLVPRMTRDQTREAIEGPIAVGKGEITPGLVNRLLNDVGDNPDQLPILQHSLMRIWDFWEKKTDKIGPIDIDHYESIGTMKEALSLHAEEAFVELPHTENNHYELLCKAIFKTLTDRGSDNRGIRRPTKISEVMKLTHASIDDIILVSSLFRTESRAFLMPPHQYELTENSILDISHESLMRVWKRLVTWVEEESESIQMYLRLCEAADQYEQRKGGLWRDPELSLAIKWKSENNPNELWAGRINDNFNRTMLFLDYSIDQQLREDQFKEYQQKARLKRARVFALSISAVALVAVGLAFWAYNEKDKAAAAQKIAAKERDKAKDLAIKATAAEKTANAARKDAEAQANYARTKEDEAKRSAIAAQQSAREAQLSANAARQSADLAQKSEKKALDAKIIAEEKTIEANSLRTVADIEALALSSINNFVQKNYDKSKQSALEAYNGSLKTKDFVNKSSLLVALWSNWNKAVNYNNSLTNHLGAVKHFAYLGSSERVLSVDEKNVIWCSRIVNGQINPLKSTKLGPDNVLAICENNKVKGSFFVLFSNGRLDMYKLSGDVPIFEKRIKENLVVKGLSRIEVNRQNIYIMSNGQLTEITNYLNAPNVKIFNGVSTFKFVNDYLFLAKNNAIETYNFQNSIGGSKLINTQSLIDFTITALDFDVKNKQLILGSRKGDMAIHGISGTSDGFEYIRKVHNSQISGIQWVEGLNNTNSVITSSYDHQIKLFTLGDLRKNTNIVKIYAHDSWIYGSEWISVNGTSGLLTASEDKSLKFNIFTLEDLYKTVSNGSK
jgi:WD40 repeat protein/energy-coupling factor transporter ATP-binding protein EcfA2